MTTDVVWLQLEVRKLDTMFRAADSPVIGIELIRPKVWLLAEQIDLGLKKCDPDQGFEYLYEFDDEEEGDGIECRAATQARVEFLRVLSDLMDLAGIEVIRHIQHTYGTGGFQWDGIGNLRLKEISNFWYNWLITNKSLLATDFDILSTLTRIFHENTTSGQEEVFCPPTRPLRG